MSISILGMGWVTPLGSGLEEVWQRLMAGESASATEISAPDGCRKRFYMPVPPKQVDWLGRMPRIRRASTITYLSVAAGLAALEDAGLTDGPCQIASPTAKFITPEIAERTAIVFAICNGGVNYTRRFYEAIVAEGAPAASPLLFPETVYNAPASHLSALLGIDNATYTLVGDATVGLSALDYAQELLATCPTLDQCVVVGGDESDWILCEAYAAWRLLSGGDRVRLHSTPPTGMLLAEGAGAIVIGRGHAKIQIEIAASTFTRRSRAGAALQSVFAQLPIEGSELVIGSANGTWIDHVEAEQLARQLPQTPAFYPKAALGEALSASSIFQVISGALALKRGEVPPSPLPHQDAVPSIRPATCRPTAMPGFQKATVTAIGLNHQAAAAVVSKA